MSQQSIKGLAPVVLCARCGCGHRVHRYGTRWQVAYHRDGIAFIVRVEAPTRAQMGFPMGYLVAGHDVSIGC